MRVTAAVFFLTSAILFTGCTKSSTSLVSPSGSKCQVSATNAPGSFSSTGGSGTVNVSAARDCTWSVSADAGWIAVQGPSSGQGDATIGYAVQANPAPAARTGSIVVSGDRLTVSQAAAPCRFALGSAGDSIGSDGGRLAVGVTTLTGCGWTSSSGASWIAVTSGQNGNGPGTVVLGVAANDGAARVGNVNVAGQNYTVSQAAKAVAPPAPEPPPTPALPPPTPPSPAPVPPPTPPPVPPAPVAFSGTISDVSGGCPIVTFHLKLLTIVTSAATTYQHGGCGDLRVKAQVSGSGLPQPDGSIVATSVAFTKD